MALGSLNLKVSKKDFEDRILVVQGRMDQLMNVIDRYGEAKKNLDQFIESGDSNYDAMLERIEENIKTARAAHTGLAETKATLQETVTLMEGMGAEVRETITSATEATVSTVKAVIKVQELL
jgi:methyl-accepting chemotaxis protein